VTGSPLDAGGALELLDWRRRIADLYAEVRAAADPSAGWDRWCEVRDELFATHPSSPIPARDRAAFAGIPVFPYDPASRVIGRLEPSSAERIEIGASDGGSFAFTRVGRVVFALRGSDRALDVFWLDGYAGGLFVPFRDATSGAETYGGGRYLLDTAKGADLGEIDGGLVLDFNFAFAPSCAHDPRWACPLAPPGNVLSCPVRAGERGR
jgi:uncharacterized protein (DUF1684 family)